MRWVGVAGKGAAFQVHRCACNGAPAFFNKRFQPPRKHLAHALPCLPAASCCGTAPTTWRLRWCWEEQLPSLWARGWRARSRACCRWVVHVAQLPAAGTGAARRVLWGQVQGAGRRLGMVLVEEQQHTTCTHSPTRCHPPTHQVIDEVKGPITKKEYELFEAPAGEQRSAVMRTLGGPACVPCAMAGRPVMVAPPTEPWTCAMAPRPHDLMVDLLCACRRCPVWPCGGLPGDGAAAGGRAGSRCWRCCSQASGHGKDTAPAQRTGEVARLVPVMLVAVVCKYFRLCRVPRMWL